MGEMMWKMQDLSNSRLIHWLILNAKYIYMQFSKNTGLLHLYSQSDTRYLLRILSQSIFLKYLTPSKYLVFNEIM